MPLQPRLLSGPKRAIICRIMQLCCCLIVHQRKILIVFRWVTYTQISRACRPAEEGGCMHDWLNGCGANWLQSWPRNSDTNPASEASKNKTGAGRRHQRVPTSGVRKSLSNAGGRRPCTRKRISRHVWQVGVNDPLTEGRSTKKGYTGPRGEHWQTGRGPRDQGGRAAAETSASWFKNYRAQIKGPCQKTSSSRIPATMFLVEGLFRS